MDGYYLYLNTSNDHFGNCSKLLHYKPDGGHATTGFGADSKPVRSEHLLENSVSEIIDHLAIS